MSAELLLREFERVVDGPDAVGRFRRFVLDLAVRGKLTQRSDTDGSASSLLSEIESRAANSQEGRKRRSSVAFAPVGPDEAPFFLPDTWLWTRVRHITRDRGQTVPSSQFTYIDVTSIDKDAGCIRNPAVLSAADAPSRARKIVSRGDVLYSCVRPYLLNIAVVDVDIDPLPIASTAFAILDGFGLVDSRYLWAVLRSPYFVECVQEKMRGQAYPAINDSDFALLPVPLPPIAEQGRIVAKVEELMALCDQLAATQMGREAQRDALRTASLHRLTSADGGQPRDVRFFLERSPRLITKPEHVAAVRQVILDLAVQGRLVPQDPADEPASESISRIAASTRFRGTIAPLPDDLATLPQGWCWARVGKLADRVTVGHVGPTTGWYISDGVPFLRSQNVRVNQFSEEGLVRISIDKHQAMLKSRIVPGDVLVVRSGANRGMSCVSPQELGEANCADLVIVQRPSGVNPHFLSFFINTVSQQYVREQVVGIAIPHFNTQSLSALPVPVPPLAEQKRIVSRVVELMAVCDELETALASAQTERGRLWETLLHEALQEGPGRVANVPAGAGAV